jgi:hypothetical protein
MNSKQSLAVASTSMLAAGMAHGAIVYSGSISNVISPGASYPVDLNQDGTLDYTAHFDGNGSANQLKPFIDSGPGDSANANAWVLSKTNAGAPVTAFETMIDANYAATYPKNQDGYLYMDHNANVVGDWSSTVDTEGYVGLELSDGVTFTNFGWAHLIYQASVSPTKTLMLVDYAYETTPNKGIPAGMISDAPYIYKEPQSQTNGAGSPTQFNVVALADPPPIFQWMAGAVGSGIYTNLPENGHFSGTTTPTLSIDSTVPSDALDYIVVVTNSIGAVTSSPPARLTVPPAVLAGPYPAQPQLFQGIAGHFGIKVVSGVPTGFQWRKDNGNLTDGAKYSGSNTSNLVIRTLAPGDAGNYDVVVTTSYGAVTSSIAPLVVVSTNGEQFVSSTLANGPLIYYRLNETNDTIAGNVVAHDNVSDFSGVYGTDVLNGNSSYNIMGPTPADGFAGFTDTNTAIQTFVNDPNATVTLPPWNLNTNTVTITAWINPQGQQAGGAAVVYTRSTNNMVCGIAYYTGFGQTDYALGYNWNDQPGDYFWNSGLTVPQNQWSFIALVITPTNGTIYVMNTNGISFAVNATPNAVQAWNDKEYIGSDPQSSTGGNNFNGKIDEVSVFNYSLTADQLQTMYANATGISALPPTITRQPISQSLYAGQTAHLAVSVTGSEPLIYQWRAGSGGIYTNLSDTGSITGTSNNLLAIHNFSAGNVADYEVIVTNSGGAVTSSVVQVSLASPEGTAYESALLSAGANGGLAAYYPLDETTDPATNGAVAYDFAGGFNGIYGTAVQNGNPNYAIAGPRPADGFIGFSPANYAALLTVSNSQSHIVCAPLYLNTNAVTITAWINPNSLPQPFAGLVFCRGSAGMVAGLDFTQLSGSGAACLGYHWNDAFGTYGWNSGLVPPTNQWSFVALVMDPTTTNATIWMINSNGISSAVNNTPSNLAMQSFNANLYIGDDPRLTDGSLVFDGRIDNVAVFNETLSSSQIQSLYNAALGNPGLQIQAVPGGVQLQWSFGTLLESPSLMGPWTTNNASSPYTVVPSGPQKFYRVIIQ